MFVSFIVLILCVFIVYIGIRVLLFHFMCNCLINDVKVAILEAYEEIETRKFYNPKND